MQRLARPARLLLAAAPVLSNQESPRHHLPIYPTDSPKPDVVEAPTQLEHAIRGTRERLTDTYLIGRAHMQMVVDRWVGIEHAVEARLKSLAPPPEVEPMFPGALWVGIVALSGSIVAQQLGPSRVRRFIYPPIWAVIAAGYFLPITTMNVFKYISELEHRYIPNAAKQQDQIIASLEKSAKEGGKKLKDLRKQFDGQVDSLADLIRSRTGLKLPEKEKKENK